MFEELRLLGPTEKSIVVQTRKGTTIENLVELDPGETERRRYDCCLSDLAQNWRQRKPATGVYNCAGHVWASRRTSILKTECWRTILDGRWLSALRDVETPVAGDLVLYADEDVGDYLHVGMILEVRDGISRESPKIPWVLSKWNSTSGEVMHHVHDVPYGRQGIPAKIEYWTDRPARDGELICAAGCSTIDLGLVCSVAGIPFHARGVASLLAAHAEVREIREALRQGAITEETIREFVSSLLAGFRVGQRFEHEMALAALAVVLERRANRFCRGVPVTTWRS